MKQLKHFGIRVDIKSKNSEYLDVLRKAAKDAKTGKCTLCGKPVKYPPAEGRMNIGGSATCEDCKNDPEMAKYY